MHFEQHALVGSVPAHGHRVETGLILGPFLPKPVYDSKIHLSKFLWLTKLDCLGVCLQLEAVVQCLCPNFLCELGEFSVLSPRARTQIFIFLVLSGKFSIAMTKYCVGRCGGTQH